MFSSQPTFLYRWNQIGMNIKGGFGAESQKRQPQGPMRGTGHFLPSLSSEERSLWTENTERGLSVFLAPADAKNRTGVTAYWVSGVSSSHTHTPWQGPHRGHNGQTLGMVLSKESIYFHKPNSYLKSKLQMFAPASQRAALLWTQIILALFLVTPMK